MADKKDEMQPPNLRLSGDGAVEAGSLADVVEWFLNYDERTARVRLPYTNELFIWKQQDDEENGIGTYPFENAEARFAIGVIQAVQQNGSEPMLGLWLTDVLGALQQARETKQEIDHTYRFEEIADSSAIEKAAKIPSKAEQRIYLTSCWLEVLFTAEARVLGWVYQDLYGKPFSPGSI